MELHGLFKQLKLNHLGLQLDPLCDQAPQRAVDY